MELSVGFRYHQGIGTSPRPSLRITARAQRRSDGNVLEELVHTRLVDCPYPADLAGALDSGLEKLQQLRHKRDPFFFDALTADQLRLAEITVG